MEAKPPNSDPSPPTEEQPRWFTAFDLAHLLIRDGAIAACAIAAWCLGQRFAVTGASPARAVLNQVFFTAISLPVGWFVGWLLRAALALLLALVLKALLGGSIRGQGDGTELGAAPDRGA